MNVMLRLSDYSDSAGYCCRGYISFINEKKKKEEVSIKFIPLPIGGNFSTDPTQQLYALNFNLNSREVSSPLPITKTCLSKAVDVIGCNQFPTHEHMWVLLLLSQLHVEK